MRAAERLTRHVRALAADLAAEYGEVELVSSRREVRPDEYDRVLRTFETFGQVGGACARVTDPEGRALLVRPEPGAAWFDPGRGLDPGEGYEACARRAVREAAGLEATVDDVERLRVFRLADGTGRPPVPEVAVVLVGRAEGDPDPALGAGAGPGGAAEARWFDRLPDPDRLGYPALAEFPLTRSPSV
jgi:ADP-ribose pyrophosphatase YjhB (NUDIX family)